MVIDKNFFNCGDLSIFLRFSGHNSYVKEQKGSCFMEKDNQTKKLPGFYIALCCCVIAIGVAGFVIQGNDTKTPEIATMTEETPMPEFAYEAVPETEIPEDAEDAFVPETGEITEDDTEYIAEDESEEDYTYDNPDVVSAAIVVNAEESCNFVDPLPEMTVKFGLCTDMLVYNEYYKDWRTHNGIDIEAPIGCSVSATAKGTVTKIRKGSYGNTVTIEHEDGFKSIYSQLGEISVKEGDTVEQGSVIGTIGESIGENMKEPHLHYELHKSGKPVNPEEY